MSDRAERDHFFSKLESPGDDQLPGSEEDHRVQGTSSAGEKVYGTPRVFDLFTMLAVTFAFAFLVAATNLLFAETSKETTVIVALYVTLIGLSQAVLFKGEEPRLASMVAGPIVMLLMFVWYAMLHPTRHWYLDMGSYLCTLVTCGVPAGYIAGGAVAGVFLVADALRKRPLLQSAPQQVDNEVRFDDIE